MKELDKLFNELKKDLKELEIEMENDEEEVEEETLTGDYMICATDEGIKICGSSAELCTLLCKIIETLNKQGISKELLQKAFDFAFMDIKDIKKETLKKIKQFLEEDDE